MFCNLYNFRDHDQVVTVQVENMIFFLLNPTLLCLWKCNRNKRGTYNVLHTFKVVKKNSLLRGLIVSKTFLRLLITISQRETVDTIIKELWLWKMNFSPIQKISKEAYGHLGNFDQSVTREGINLNLTTLGNLINLNFIKNFSTIMHSVFFLKVSDHFLFPQQQ